MYVLCVDENSITLRLSGAKSWQLDLNYTDEVVKYNDCYYTCNKKELLKEFALEIKSKWLFDAENRLNSIENIKI